MKNMVSYWIAKRIMQARVPKPSIISANHNKIVTCLKIPYQIARRATSNQEVSTLRKTESQTAPKISPLL